MIAKLLLLAVGAALLWASGNRLFAAAAVVVGIALVIGTVADVGWQRLRHRH